MAVKEVTERKGISDALSDEIDLDDEDLFEGLHSTSEEE